MARAGLVIDPNLGDWGCVRRLAQSNPQMALEQSRANAPLFAPALLALFVSACSRAMAGRRLALGALVRLADHFQQRAALTGREPRNLPTPLPG
jgi:hypothetical protein